MSVHNRLVFMAGIAVALMASTLRAEIACESRMLPGEINFGSQNRGQMLDQPVGSELTLGSRRTRLVIQCAAPTHLSLAYIAPAAGADSYRFGDGRVLLTLHNAQADGQEVLLAQKGAQTQASQELLLKPEQQLLFLQDGQPVVATSFSLNVSIETRISPNATRVRAPTVLETRGYFQPFAW
ncbi:hypothetical protein [Pseudomonas sp. GZD-222]|uniref:hypothetical protein n=1 Tax=Pseudomonas sp. GZD-222 TaxID=3404805 RepID=UPI003BB49256